MRVATRWLVVGSLILFSPAPAWGQSPTRAALVGTWLRTAAWRDSTGKDRLESDTLVLHPDSTWEMNTVNAAKSNGFGASGCWFLSDDSFSFGPPVSAKTVHGRTLVSGYLPIKVSLAGQELTMKVPNPIDTTPKVYKRIGDARPRPPAAQCK